MSSDFALEPGDLVEIRYRVLRVSGGADELIDRWIAAEIIDCEPGAWPLARLVDGQITEIRRFMEWRLVPLSRSRSRPLAA